jgi:glycosyltransferase involved in cell wall biosynthesis
VTSGRPKDVLVVQPSIQPPGGGNGVCAWMIEALTRDYSVDILTWEPIDLEAVNRHCGTALRMEDFRTLGVSRTLRALINSIPASLGLLRMAILLRECKRIGRDYRLVLAVNNEADFGRPGIQYVHYPWAFFQHPEVDDFWYQRSRVLVNLYYSLCIAVCRYTVHGMRRNLTLVNSDWTREKVRERHGIEGTTLYPPVAGSFPSVPWSEREEGFVCVGRFSGEKRLEEVVAVVEAVREARPRTRLHIAGTRSDAKYYRRVLRLVREHSEWVTLHEGLARDDLIRLMASQKYGIHGMLDEHFGMAIAEMVRAGCIVFVPRGGGQVEIVQRDERLTYVNESDAVAKILRVMSSEAEQRDIRMLLEMQWERFSVETFTRRFREIVAEFDAAHSPARESASLGR